MIVRGAPALSGFRLRKLLPRLREVAGTLEAVETRFVHFVDLSRALNADETRTLESLLRYGPRSDVKESSNAQSLWVIPRPGTISPWASKATDIAKVCGLDAVRRIERGIEYRLIAPTPLDHSALAAIAPMLHDRMTEIVIDAASNPQEHYAGYL
jgi:phosphoribosylformylglycinamidine synthase